MNNLFSSEPDDYNYGSQRQIAPVSFLESAQTKVYNINDTSKLKPQSHFRNINVPYFADDFYSNLLDWVGPLIYYGIGPQVYAYNYFTEETEKIFSSDYIVTSVKYNRQQDILVVGTATGVLHTIKKHEMGIQTQPRTLIDDYDSNTICKRPKRINFNTDDIIFTHSSQVQEGINLHRSRIGTLQNYADCIITGSRDRKCKMVDLRSNKIVNVFSAHSQELCGLAIDKSTLATGGNDNKICVFDLRNTAKLQHKIVEHKAAVKALSLKNNTLYSGGGSADKTIKQTSIGGDKYVINQSVCFNSQITNLYLTKSLNKEILLSTFGYSDDDIKVIEPNNQFKAVKKYEGHRNRVIHFAISDDKTCFATGSGDKTIKIWKLRENENDLRIR